MSPDTRLATILFGSFLLCLPALGAMVSDDLEPTSVGLRFAAGAAFVWIALRVIEALVGGYATPPDADAVTIEVDGAENQASERRRETDVANGTDGARETPMERTDSVNSD